MELYSLFSEGNGVFLMVKPYNIDCCWNETRDLCVGESCECFCHVPVKGLNERIALLTEAKQVLDESIARDFDTFHSIRALKQSLYKTLEALLIEARVETDK